jgi:transposase
MLVTATLPPSLQVAVVALSGRDEGGVTVALASNRPAVACPACGSSSQRVHSRYRRTLADLPWQGLTVQLELAVRRFFCESAACPRRTFAEQFPGLAAVRGRRSDRLTTLFSAVGLALGGEPGARLVGDLGLETSPDTLLRLVRALSAPAATPVRVLGVDDWAKRRGHRYGTILVDLERHEVIDLLPDRDAATLSAWLKQHPEIEIISRDRASAYAEGAREGAPQAVQVADRWHLLKNVGDALERVLQGQPAAVRAAAQVAGAVAVADLAPAVVPDLECAPPSAPAPAPAPQHGLGDQRRQERYAQVLALAVAGQSVCAIQRETGLSRMTIRKYLRAAACPVRAPRAGLLAPGSSWEKRLRERWDAGCQNANTLWEELRAAGFPGCAGTVRRHVGAWRAERGRRGRPVARLRTAAAGTPAPQPVPSPRQVKWWLLGVDEDRTEEQRAYVRRLLGAVPLLATAQQVTLEFGRVVRERDHAAFPGWLQQAEESGVPELRSVAVGMRRDRAAIEAALVLPWSQGQTEGQVTRLKLVKRAMYGRGGLDLLRSRLRRGA